jgi:uracil-DNA glycosylase
MICLANWTFQIQHTKKERTAYTVAEIVTKKLDKYYLERDNATITNMLRNKTVSDVLKKLVINPETNLPKVINIYFSKDLTESFQSTKYWQESILSDQRNYFSEICTTTKKMQNETVTEKCPIWSKLFDQESKKQYFKDLYLKVSTARKSGNVYPVSEETFRAFKLTHYNDTRVVIFGQDPYHTPNTADGLAFSSKGKNTPPSLNNVFKEIKSSFPDVQFKSCDLTAWAVQGVLLLNSSLTVNQGQPGSHKDFGWTEYIKAIIAKLNEKAEPVIFCLWGQFAKNFESLIAPQHIILKAGHPSPLNAKNDFIGCGHFEKINEILNDNPINWNTL